MSWYNPWDWGDSAHQLIDPGNFVWDHKSNAPTQYANDDQFKRALNAGFYGNVANQQAPQLQMGNDPFRAAQLQQMGQLQGQSDQLNALTSGQQQGAGELAAQRQYANAMAAQQSLARSQRGGNAALAYRNAANQGAALGSSAAGMGQQAAMGDQQAARQQQLAIQGQLANVGASGRQNDVGVANANAGYQAGTNQQNAGNYLQLLNQMNQRDQNKYNADLGIGAQKDAAANSKTGGLIGGLGAVIASDERLKTEITDARSEVDDLLNSLAPKAYSYKDTKHGEGRRVGIMAQDMLRSTAGARIVHEDDEGLKLDVNKALSAALASSARLNERVNALEGKAK